MPLSSQSAVEEVGKHRESRAGAFRLVSLLAWLVAAALAWLCPQPKPDAILGRLSYGQFWLAVCLTLIALFVLALKCLKPSLRRPVGFRAAAVLLSFFLALALAEILAAVLPVRHQMDNPWYLSVGGGASSSDILPFERPPHLAWEGLSRGDLAILNGDMDPYARTVTFETDMDGFRNSKDLEQADLITIGDSFTEAGNVLEEETFTAIAGERLGVTSRNLGRAGYTAATELIVLKKFGLECRPKAVVWQLAESNDLSEMLAYEKWVSRGRPRYFDDRPEPTSWEGWQMRSPSFRLFLALREDSPHEWPLGGTFQDEHGSEHPVRFLWAPGLHPPARGHQAWPAFSQTLLHGARLCRSNNIRLLLLMIPMKARVRGPYTDLNDSATNVLSRSPGDSLGAVLKTFCAKHQIPFVDATRALQAQAETGKIVYLPFDTHLSPLGHEIVADLIVSHLKVPPSAQ